jgi:sulfur carrier protein ThiS
VRVTVDLRGDLARRVTTTPLDGGTIELPEEASVGELAAALGLVPASAVFAVNNVAVRSAHRLREGDRVQAFPASAGG